MSLIGLDHLQLAMPADGEAAARAFYGNLLGLVEVAKPAALVGRSGLWFRLGDLELHLGVDPAFRPATKAHPGLLADDLNGLIARLGDAGCDCAPERDHRGRPRIYLSDPFGNSPRSNRKNWLGIACVAHACLSALPR